MSCGTCTLCCKLMGIPELKKPTNAWCPHCVIGTGCGIYEDRPKSCREYECLWLQSQGRPEGQRMGQDLRPDRVGVVISPTTDPDTVSVHVDPVKADAWKHGEIGQLLARMANVGLRVVISKGEQDLKKIVLTRLRPGVVGHRTVTMTPPDENGMQWSIPD